MKIVQRSAIYGFLMLLCSPVMAQVAITETTTPITAGSNFSYTINNIGQAPIVSLSISVSTVVTNIVSPAGWNGGSVSLGDSTIIDWTVSDIPFELKPGSTLSGFSFVSTSTVGNIQYSAFDENFNNYDGTTQGPVPAAVPEISSMTSFGIGLILLTMIALVIRFRAKRKARIS